MFLSDIHADGFRNLQTFQIDLSGDINIVYGDNAAGKSSLLEAICYLISGRSFRTAKQGLLVTHNLADFTLFGRFSDSTMLGVNYNNDSKSRKIKLNGEVVRSLSSIASLYPVQVLSPESYHLIDSGPLERRKYLDWLLFHVEHNYQQIWNDFYRLLKQRNAYLKNNQRGVKTSELNAWNEPYELASTKVNQLRESITNKVFPNIRRILSTLDFEHANDLTISYYSGYTGNLYDKLNESLSKDLLTGNTQYGPHKGDLRLKIGKHLAKDILSRGQKKLLVNSMYLAQTEILKEITQKDSLFIIDDFTSELDDSNQQMFILALKEQTNIQIILSCLQADMLKPLIKGYNNVKMFHVEQGGIKLVQ